MQEFANMVPFSLENIFLNICMVELLASYPGHVGVVYYPCMRFPVRYDDEFLIVEIRHTIVAN